MYVFESMARSRAVEILPDDNPDVSQKKVSERLSSFICLFISRQKLFSDPASIIARAMAASFPEGHAMACKSCLIVILWPSPI